MKNILDPKFKYVPAAATDVRETIEREKRRLAAEARKKKREAKRQAEGAAETARVVTPIKRSKP